MATLTICSTLPVHLPLTTMVPILWRRIANRRGMRIDRGESTNTICGVTVTTTMVRLLILVLGVAGSTHTGEWTLGWSRRRRMIVGMRTHEGRRK